MQIKGKGLKSWRRWSLIFKRRERLTFRKEKDTFSFNEEEKEIFMSEWTERWWESNTGSLREVKGQDRKMSVRNEIKESKQRN